MNTLTRITLALLAVIIASTANAQPTPNWPSEAVDILSRVPIQEGGRVKPLDTFARVKLLQISGMKSMRLEDGAKRSAMEWLLDTIFYPETAATYDIFLIESREAMQALRLPSDDPRDRFSYQEIVPAQQELFRLGMQYAQIDSSQRTPAQTQIVNLTHNIHDFDRLMSSLDFARGDTPLSGADGIAQLFGEAGALELSTVLASAPELMDRLSGGQRDNSMAEAARLAQTFDHAATRSTMLALFPPTIDGEIEWDAPADFIGEAFTPGADTDRLAAYAAALEQLEETKSDPSAFTGASKNLLDVINQTPPASDVENKVALEIFLYNLNPFTWALALYILAFIAAAVACMVPASNRASLITLALLAAPLVLHVVGITLRCIIRERPPVSTLYETILFISAVCVLVGMFIEFINRRKIGAFSAAILGGLGLFLANKYEMVERSDTMPALIAVLDTNFWLSTHVTTITIGYAAGLLAAAVAHIYIFAKLFRIRQNDRQFYKGLARMIYGIICFGILFSTLGTVLGGIWANDSWGRFWGWDPKENGALMIVLWQLAILHWRMGGYIKDFGLAMTAVFNAIIVAFSWFGVNLLGVGLHSYGFTSGIALALTIFYAIESAVLFIAAYAWLREKGIVAFVSTTETTAKDENTAQASPQVS